MGSDGGNTYIVMEFLHGEDLAQRLERLGPVGIEEMADIMLPVCSAVAAAHAAGITHRDLKPQNIFLGAGTRRVHPKVLDFGISKGNDAVTQAGTLTGTGAMIGTPYYLAPEQIMDSKSAGSASDQYALGIILYECLTGKRPYDGDNLFVVFQGIVGGTPRRPRELRPEIPPEMEEVTLRAMRSDPKQRFPTIEDFGRALLPFASARARMIWDEAFSGAATGTDSVPPGRPSIAVMPTPSPATRASTLMPPGLKNPSGVGPIPGAPTPTPPPKTMMWQSPVPQSRPPTGATLPGSPESTAAASVRASVAMSKSHPVVTEVSDDGMDLVPPPTRSKKGIVIVGVVAVAVAGGALFFLRGGSSDTKTTAAPATAPAAVAPAAAPAPAAARPVPPAPGPAAAAELVKPAAIAPPEVKPAAPTAEEPQKPASHEAHSAAASAKHENKGEGKGKSKSHGHGGAATKPAAGKPAAAGVPVLD
jgi:serine/threonine-protein kinase